MHASPTSRGPDHLSHSRHIEVLTEISFIHLTWCISTLRTIFFLNLLNHTQSSFIYDMLIAWNRLGYRFNVRHIWFFFQLNFYQFFLVLTLEVNKLVTCNYLRYETSTLPEIDLVILFEVAGISDWYVWIIQMVFCCFLQIYWNGEKTIDCCIYFT